jgi:glycosyltransferase involved in cell wall biosynthesis
MAVAQALTWGLPVISTRTGAIPELVPPGAGLLIDPEDCDALREALSRLLLDPTLRRRLAAGARCAGAKLPDWPAASRRLSDVLLEIGRRASESPAT